MSTATANKLKTKDIITVVLLALINVVIFFASSVLYATPITIILMPVFFALLEGIVYFIIGTKVKKPGAILIYSIVRAIMGGYLPYIILFILSGFIAELLLWKMGYGNAKALTISYIINQVLAAFGSTIIPYAIAAKAMADQMVTDGRQDAILAASQMLQSWVSVALVAGVIVAALIGAAILGPRIGKYTKDGKARAIPGHSLTLGALGCFILWFCWFGFNGGSTVAMEGLTNAADGSEMTMGALAGSVFSTTNMAAAVATVTTMLFTWIRYKKPDVSMSLNGTLAGLVIVTASTDCIDMYGAAIEGIIAGIAVVLVIEFIDKVCKVDDPVGAVGVHFANGLLGTICVGLFSTGQNGVGAGLFYGGGFKQLGIQLLGVVTVCAWVGVTMIIVFEVLKHTIGLRVPADIEIKGLDYAEHGLASAYSGFEFAANDLTIASDDEIEVFGSEKMENAVPAVVKTSPEKENKITKVEILAKQSKFEKLKKAMNDIGVTGMTVTQVLGCGTQKGAPEYYRGVEVDMQLLPKIQVEMVVSKVPVADVIDAARKALYTGHIGDGKIFVYDVEDVVKVRTGETGYDALQGADD